MKKIGIITFHWATNYGAVLQSYALQHYLSGCGYDTEIIDYVPWSIVLSQSIKWKKNHRLDLISREKKLETFRTNYLVRSKRVKRCSLLRRYSKSYYAVICGSDQIWNQSFTLFGEYKPTLAYFANFVGKETKRIAYAASFGTSEVCERYKNITKPELVAFTAISVREQTGKQIVEKLGMEAEVVCDPTLLLTKDEYCELTKDVTLVAPKVFSYVLHEHKETVKIANYVKKVLKDDRFTNDIIGMNEWLYVIQHSKIVVTNSFHGLMLSIIFNKPFIAVLIKGSGMNDRIITILRAVGLEKNAVDSFEENTIDMVLHSPIDWDYVNQKLCELRNQGRGFLKKALFEQG